MLTSQESARMLPAFGGRCNPSRAVCGWVWAVLGDGLALVDVADVDIGSGGAGVGGGGGGGVGLREAGGEGPG